MKKLFTLLFTAVVVFALAMPVFAQDASQDQSAAQSTDQGMAKTKKTKKMKKAKTKKEKKMEKTDQTPPPSQ